MRDERLASARDGQMRRLLAALWSFLQHPATTVGDHLTALEERIRTLERRFAGDLKTLVDTGVVAVEETVAGAEHRLEQDLKSAIHSRVAGIQARLEAVKTHVVEDLKHELHRMARMLALAMSCAALALVGMIFGLMAAWTGLRSFVGALDASLALAILFLLAGLVVFGLLRSILHRSRPPPGAGKTAT